MASTSSKNQSDPSGELLVTNSAAIDNQCLSGDKAGHVGSKEKRSFAHFFGHSPSLERSHFGGGLASIRVQMVIGCRSLDVSKHQSIGSKRCK
jgi:hypothetical protein